jgi:hypothetical protein
MNLYLKAEWLAVNFQKLLKFLFFVSLSLLMSGFGALLTFFSYKVNQTSLDLLTKKI